MLNLETTDEGDFGPNFKGCDVGDSSVEVAVARAVECEPSLGTSGGG